MIHKHELCVSSATPGFAHWIVGNQVWKNSKFFFIYSNRAENSITKRKQTCFCVCCVYIINIPTFFFHVVMGETHTQARHTAAGSQTSSSNLRQSSFRCCCRPLTWIWCKVARASPRWSGWAVDSAIVFSPISFVSAGLAGGFGDRRLFHLNAN